MSKKAKKQQQPPPSVAKSSDSEGIVVSQIESVTDVCRATIEPIIKIQYLGFNQEALARRRFKCMLVGGAEATRAYERETYTVHPFPEVGSDLYWLAVALYFQFEKGRYKFEGVSLLVFRGRANDPTKTAVLRAEWDCTNKVGHTVHAQPHWQIFPTAIDSLADRGRPAFDEQTKVREFDPSEESVEEVNDVETLKRVSDFHFAMAAKWHCEENAPQQVPLNQVDELVRWMKGCISYTIEQLRYLNK